MGLGCTSNTFLHLCETLLVDKAVDGINQLGSIRSTVVDMFPGITDLRELGYARLSALRRAVSTIAERLERQLTELTEIGLSEFEALDLIERSPAVGLRMIDLATAMLLSPSSVTRITDRLEDRHFVERHSSSVDRREFHIVLTAAGKAKIEAARPFLLEAIPVHAAPLSAEQAPNIDEFLSLMAAQNRYLLL
jgi:DNA-binding MarR family transcriptional regulator